MGLLKKLFIFVLFIFPLGEVARINLGNGIVVRPLDIEVGLIVFLWVIFKLKEKESVKLKYILLPILLFAASGFFSLLINYSSLSLNQFFASMLYLIRWIVYAGIFFVVSEFDNKFRKKIINLLIIVGAIVVVLGYMQYFFYSNLKGLIYLGWDEHMYRMFSVFLDPNFAGTFFVLFFLLILSIFFKKKSILIGFLLILTLGAIFLTFSRSALIMLIVSSILLFTLMNRKIWIALLLGFTSLALAISSRYFNIENINFFRLVSAEARFETSKNAIKIIQDHPIFGVGFNSYRYAQLRYGLRNDKAKTISHADASPDNSFLFVIATTGLVGFAFFIFLWFRILKHNVKNNPLLASSIIGVFISSLFINSLFYPFIMMWIWIIIAITENR